MLQPENQFDGKPKYVLIDVTNILGKKVVKNYWMPQCFKTTVTYATN